jgi:CRP-like cAMP-binding protein
VALVEAKTLNTLERFTLLVQQLAAVLEVPRTQRPLRLPLPLSDGEMASLLGVTKEYFSRRKRHWESEGHFHWEGRTLVILNPVSPAQNGHFRQK